MNSKRNALWVAIVAAGLVAGGARAQDDYGFEDETAPAPKPVYENYIELGGGYTEDGNGKFGEYTNSLSDAFKEDGGFAVGSLHLSGGDRDAAREWDVSAGMGNGRSLEASYSVQGNYGLSLYGDSIEKIEYGDARTVYLGDSPIQRLPTGYVPGTSAGNPAFYTAEDIGSERAVLGLEGFKHIGKDWTVSLGFENQDKTGDDVIGGNQGFGGTALVPETLNHTTQQMRGRIDYATACLQQGVEVYLSKFENDNDRVAYENAQYAPVGVEQIALEPDNEFFRLGLDGGFNFDRRNRISWFADWSTGEQDENFLPVVRDTAYYPTVNPVFLGASSLDGEVERTSLKLTLVGRPFGRFDYRLQYDYKDRDAQHDAFPVNEISYTGGFSPGFSSRVYDKQSQSLSLEGGYRFGSHVRLRGGYEYEETDRDTDEFEYDSVLATYDPIAFTDSTDEDRYFAQLDLGGLGALSLKFRAEYNVISADLSDETAGFISPGGVGRRATPVFLVDRDQDVFRVEADYEIGHNMSAYASYDMIGDDYDNDTYGIDSRDSEVFNVGLSWAASKALNLSAYGSHEEYEIEQLGRQMGSTPVPFSEWRVDSADDVDALGLTLDWAVIEDRLDFSADFAYMQSDSAYSSNPQGTQGVVLVTGDTPDTHDQLYRLSLSGVYHWNDRIDVTGRYIYEDRDADDWGWSPDIAAALNPSSPTQESARYVAFAYERPNYTSQAVLMSVRYKF